jgi:hypothetical protein
MDRPTIIERAFELAQSGTCQSLDELRSQLKRERYESVDSHMAGPTLGRQLRKLFQERRTDQAPAGPTL